MKKWLHEPLLHFLLIGAVLFLIYSLQNDGSVDQDNRIVFTKADLNRLSLIWERKRQRPPTQIELKGLIENQIREQVMYREALAMGLDKNDSIVRRRLAQKLEFITADLAALVEPSENDLADYLASHGDIFKIPGRISFVQIYLNPDRRGNNAENDAFRLLGELKQDTRKVDIKTAGDPFMLGLQHQQLTKQDTTRLFGQDFANKLFTLPIDSWQGPVQSGFGLHLVRIDNKTTTQQPKLDAVRDKVRNEWVASQRRTVDKAFYQSLRQRYDIVIDDVDLSNIVVSGLVTNDLVTRVNR